MKFQNLITKPTPSMFGDLRFDVIVYLVHILDFSHDDMVINIWFGYV